MKRSSGLTTVLSIALGALCLFGAIALAQSPAPQPGAPAPVAPAQPAGPGQAPATKPGDKASSGTLTVQPTHVRPTVPQPKDLPAVQDMEQLMNLMKSANKRVSDPNREVAMKAAKEIEALTLASVHPRLRTIKEAEYGQMALALWRVNQEVQNVLQNSTDQRMVVRALNAQNAACKACHDRFRHE